MKLCYIAPWRHIVIVMALLGIILAFSQRVCLNIAILEMVSHDNFTVHCSNWANETIKVLQIGEKQPWTQTAEVIVLAAFYLGYIFVHILGPLVCNLYGAKYPILIGIGISSVATGLIPIFTKYVHWSLVAGLRVLTGAGQGVLFPAAAHLLLHWSPVDEVGVLTAVTYSGNWLGLTNGYVISGTLMVMTEDWCEVFYFWAILGIIYILFGFVFIYSKPEDDPHIYPMELEILVKPTIPANYLEIYKNMLKDTAVWGLSLGQIGHTAVMSIMVIYLPKYLYFIGFDVENITMYMCNPYSAMAISGYIAGISTKKALKKHSLGCIRKVNTILQSVFTGGFLIIATFLTCEDMFLLTITTIVLGFEGFYYEGLRKNAVDLSINHNRYINAFSNGIGNIGVIITSAVIVIFVRDNTLDEWRLAFMIIACLQIFTAILFVCLGSGNSVKWDPEEPAAPPRPTTTPR